MKFYITKNFKFNISNKLKNCRNLKNKKVKTSNSKKLNLKIKHQIQKMFKNVKLKK